MVSINWYKLMSLIFSDSIPVPIERGVRKPKSAQKVVDSESNERCILQITTLLIFSQSKFLGQESASRFGCILIFQ